MISLVRELKEASHGALRVCAMSNIATPDFVPPRDLLRKGLLQPWSFEVLEVWKGGFLDGDEMEVRVDCG